MFNNFTPLEVSKEHKARLLEDSGWIKELTWEQTVQLAEFLDNYICPPGTEFLKEGVQSSFMCLIAKGSAKVLKLNKEKEEIEIAALSSGSTFGEVSLIDNRQRSATVVASKECSLLVLTAVKFKMLCEYKPDIALKITLKITAMLASRLRRTSGKLVDYLEEDQE